MPRTFRLAVLVGLFVMAGLAFPSVADAQRRGGSGGGGGARGAAPVRAGGAAVHGRGVYGGSHVAVPRTHPPYSYYRPYYSRPYYYRPYYSGYYPHSYSPWSFSLSFGFGWYGGYYAPFYAYPYYPPTYITPYPAYSYPYRYPPPYPYPSQNPSQPDYPPPTSDNRYNNTPSTRSHSTYQAEVRTTTAGGGDRGEFGTLSMRVMPSDATILIDQEAWDRPRGDDRFSIELVEGTHHVEIRKAGYATYARTIDVPRGRSVVVNVALTPGGTANMQVTRTVPLRHP
jgi:PEGA domain